MQQSIDLHPCFPSERQQCGQSYYESEFDAEILGIKQDLFCTFYAHLLIQEIFIYSQTWHFNLKGTAK